MKKYRPVDTLPCPCCGSENVEEVSIPQRRMSGVAVPTICKDCKSKWEALFESPRCISVERGNVPEWKTFTVIMHTPCLGSVTSSGFLVHVEAVGAAQAAKAALEKFPSCAVLGVLEGKLMLEEL